MPGKHSIKKPSYLVQLHRSFASTSGVFQGTRTSTESESPKGDVLATLKQQHSELKAYAQALELRVEKYNISADLHYKIASQIRLPQRQRERSVRGAVAAIIRLSATQASKEIARIKLKQGAESADYICSLASPIAISLQEHAISMVELAGRADGVLAALRSAPPGASPIASDYESDKTHGKPNETLTMPQPESFPIARSSSSLVASAPAHPARLALQQELMERGLLQLDGSPNPTSGAFSEAASALMALPPSLQSSIAGDPGAIDRLLVADPSLTVDWDSLGSRADSHAGESVVGGSNSYDPAASPHLPTGAPDHLLDAIPKKTDTSTAPTDERLMDGFTQQLKQLSGASQQAAVSLVTTLVQMQSICGMATEALCFVRSMHAAGIPVRARHFLPMLDRAAENGDVSTVKEALKTMDSIGMAPTVAIVARQISAYGLGADRLAREGALKAQGDVTGEHDSGEFEESGTLLQTAFDYAVCVTSDQSFAVSRSDRNGLLAAILAAFSTGTARRLGWSVFPRAKLDHLSSELKLDENSPSNGMTLYHTDSPATLDSPDEGSSGSKATSVDADMHSVHLPPSELTEDDLSLLLRRIEAAIGIESPAYPGKDRGRAQGRGAASHQGEITYLAALRQHIERHGPFDALVDGANLAHTLHADRGTDGFSFPHLIHAVSSIRGAGLRPLVVLHRKWLTRSRMQPLAEALSGRDQRGHRDRPAGLDGDQLLSTFRKQIGLPHGQNVTANELADRLTACLAPVHGGMFTTWTGNDDLFWIWSALQGQISLLRASGSGAGAEDVSNQTRSARRSGLARGRGRGRLAGPKAHYAGTGGLLGALQGGAAARGIGDYDSAVAARGGETVVLPRRVYVVTNDAMRDHGSMSECGPLFARWRLLHTIRPLSRFPLESGAVGSWDGSGASIPVRVPPVVAWHAHRADGFDGEAGSKLLALPASDISADVEMTMRIPAAPVHDGSSESEELDEDEASARSARASVAGRRPDPSALPCVVEIPGPMQWCVVLKRNT